MVLNPKTSMKASSTADFIQLVLATFALLAATAASVSVLLNNVYFWGQSPHYITPYLFLGALLLALPRKRLGLMACIFLLPLSAGLGAQLNAYVGTHFLALPNPGLDLAAGFFLGSLARSLPDIATWFKSNDKCRQYAALIRQLVPWPIALVITMITLSTAIAIFRNIYQSAAATSLKGLLFNLVHFRPIGWHDDYMPISDWVAYALAVAIVMIIIGYLKDQPHKNHIIFRPIIAGLIVAALMGILQAVTGLGLPESLLSFRTDLLGYAVIGFQPDLHAFAGHMLLGTVGLWGYFYSGISKFEKKIILFTVALSWGGLILSKSRALLLFALVAMVVWLFVYLWINKRRYFAPVTLLGMSLFAATLFIVVKYSNSLSGIPVLSWAGELVNQFKSRDLTSWSLFSGIFGTRFEIWEGAIRMWSQFPLMGIGQGNFYRLSDIASFSKSNFLILNHGENAHNYFLQTLTETGIVGVIVLLIALLAPIIVVKNKKLLIPAGIAILSLFLGNVFSHSFLVRENFLLASIIFGLLCVSSQNLNYSEKLNSRTFLFFINNAQFIGKALSLLLLLILIAGTVEIYKSFGKYPFERGYYCYLNPILNNDGWTSGQYLIDLPYGSRKLEVVFDFRNNGLLDSRPPELAVDLINSHVLFPVIIQKFYDQSSKKLFLKLSLESNKKIEEKNIKVRITMQDCFTPRNLGVSLDSRRLGGVIESSQVW